MPSKAHYSRHAWGRAAPSFVAFALAFALGFSRPTLARNENAPNPSFAGKPASADQAAAALAPAPGAASAPPATPALPPASQAADLGADVASPPSGDDPDEAAGEGESLPEPVMLDGGISVAIGGDQRATIIGETPSLRAVVEEICRQASVDLRAYKAPDRRYVGKLENMPLADAFRSMLRTESYLVWVREYPRGTVSKVTGMRVLGTEPATPQRIPVAASEFAPAQPTSYVAPPPAARFSMSTALLFQAFGTFDPVRRDQAQREIIDRISEPEQLQRFLQTDVKLLASMFGRYRDSELTLGRLKSLSDNAEIQGKFQEILNQMAATPPEQDEASR